MRLSILLIEHILNLLSKLIRFKGKELQGEKRNGLYCPTPGRLRCVNGKANRQLARITEKGGKKEKKMGI